VSVDIEHRYLRGAIEFAVRVADAGQRQRPPVAYPAALKPYLKQSRVPASVLGKLRRAIEKDDAFRGALAHAIEPGDIDPMGYEWLRREEGWEERVAGLIAEAKDSKAQESADAARRRAERQRAAAEERAARAESEQAQLQKRGEDLKRAVAEQRRRADDVEAELAAVRSDLAEARKSARHASQREDAARQRLERVEAERDDAAKRAAVAEAQRDELLAERAERSGVRVAPDRIGELSELAKAARLLADRLGGLVEPPASRRRSPLTLPGGVRRNSPQATEFLLQARAALVLVDGYNVAKLGWPDEELDVQRDRLLDTVDRAARRFRTEFAVVFDGADVVGAHTRQRRLARVVYSPAGVIADDVIRDEVAATPSDRPVVVITNDQAVQHDVTAAGANVVTSDSFLAVTR
jgi:predicted RNA-binding protein with PIN domain